MNKEDYNKMSTFDKINYDIQMELYQDFNDEIASINDRLGEIYGYNDLKDAEEAEMKEEIEKYKKALKEKCEAIDKATEYINSKYVNEYDTILTYYEIETLLEILKGEE